MKPYNTRLGVVHIINIKILTLRLTRVFRDQNPEGIIKIYRGNFSFWWGELNDRHNTQPFDTEHPV